MMRRRLNHVPALLWCFYDLHPELMWLINIRFDLIDDDLRDPSVYCQISFTAHWSLIKRRSRQCNGFIRVTDSSVFLSRASVCPCVQNQSRLNYKPKATDWEESETEWGWWDGHTETDWVWEPLVEIRDTGWITRQTDGSFNLIWPLKTLMIHSY